jgi:SAM-dependent methyltransferase
LIEEPNPFTYYIMTENIDARLDYPATGRNQKPILDVLNGVLPAFGTVLEVASGSGQHITYFAQQMPHLKWQPSDPESVARESIEAWRYKLGVEDLVHPALNLDARVDIWSLAHIKDLSAILSINMIHISPWEAYLGLLKNAQRVLSPGGVLYLYGPFKVGDVHVTQSNADFDLSLQSQNQSWGVRNLDDVAEEALKQNFQLMKTVRMPANNLSVIFHKKN